MNKLGNWLITALMKQVRRLQQYQLRRQPVPCCSWCSNRKGITSWLAMYICPAKENECVGLLMQCHTYFCQFVYTSALLTEGLEVLLIFCQTAVHSNASLHSSWQALCQILCSLACTRSLTQHQTLIALFLSSRLLTQWMTQDSIGTTECYNEQKTPQTFKWITYKALT